MGSGTSTSRCESARRYQEAGVDRLVLQPSDFTGSEIDDLIEHTAEHLIRDGNTAS